MLSLEALLPQEKVWGVLITVGMGMIRSGPPALGIVEDAIRYF
jgi:hypothetical protein